MTTSDMTPSDLAHELGHDDGGQKVRVFLRSIYGTLPEPGDRWLLTPEQVSMVRGEFVSER